MPPISICRYIMHLWSSGYDVSLTRWRSPVRSWPGVGISGPQAGREVRFISLNFLNAASIQTSKWCHQSWRALQGVSRMAGFGRNLITVQNVFARTHVLQTCPAVAQIVFLFFCWTPNCKLTWLVLGWDPAVCSHRVEQFTALWGL